MSEYRFLDESVASDDGDTLLIRVTGGEGPWTPQQPEVGRVLDAGLQGTDPRATFRWMPAQQDRPPTALGRLLDPQLMPAHDDGPAGPSAPGQQDPGQQWPGQQFPGPDGPQGPGQPHPDQPYPGADGPQRPAEQQRGGWGFGRKKKERPRRPSQGTQFAVEHGGARWLLGLEGGDMLTNPMLTGEIMGHRLEAMTELGGYVAIRVGGSEVARLQLGNAYRTTRVITPPGVDTASPSFAIMVLIPFALSHLGGGGTWGWAAGVR